MTKMLKKYKFSIVIPTRNRAYLLHKVLNCITDLKYDRKLFEVIIVNNNSVDDTNQTVRAVLGGSDINWRLLSERRIGPSFCRNKGIRNAQYPFLVFIDDDVLFAKNLLNKYKFLIQKYPQVSFFGGRIVPASQLKSNSKKLVKYLRFLGEYSWVFSTNTKTGNRFLFLKYPDMLVSANICINTKNTGKILFDTRFGRMYKNLMIFAEDTELCHRLLLKGNEILYYPDLISTHIIPDYKLTWSYIIKRIYQSGIEQKLINKYSDLKGQSQLYKYNFKNDFFLFARRLLKKKSVNFIFPFIFNIIFYFGFRSNRAAGIVSEAFDNN